MLYAELIGDPVAHSRSPAIHNFWLSALGLNGEYRATRVREHELAAYLVARRSDQDWCGCNVTAPLKLAILPHLGRLSEEAASIGAVNCVMPMNDALVGLNTDIDGVAEALAPLADVPEAAIIGGGGAARAAAWYLFDHGCAILHLLLRNPATATGFLAAPKGGRIVVHALGAPEQALTKSSLLINAAPMGMPTAEPPPERLLKALRETPASMTVFDMVYEPAETALLHTARAAGHETIGGLEMLVGQARHAFWLFFGNNTPRARDRDLHEALGSSGG